MTGTYFAHALADADLEHGGRFASLSKPIVTGAGHEYPRQPETAPGNQAALVGDEPPIGIDVNALEPVGTAVEIERSIAEIEKRRA